MRGARISGGDFYIAHTLPLTRMIAEKTDLLYTPKPQDGADHPAAVGRLTALPVLAGLLDEFVLVDVEIPLGRVDVLVT